VTKRTVYTAESLDIVTHEAGHAILDVYQPGYWSTIDLETAAFHEAFGDCTALLVTLTDPAVCRAFLDETKGAARKSNLVSRLAEALGRRSTTTTGRARSAIPADSGMRTTRSATHPRHAPPERSRRGALGRTPLLLARLHGGVL
jgi:hypothetical protein